MPLLVKRCPDCGNQLHVRKSLCPCGHVFKSGPSITLDGLRKSNAASQARKRVLESEQETGRRRQANAACQAHRKAIETEHESDQRKQANAACTARRRALETEHESEHHRQANATRQARKRAIQSEYDTSQTNLAHQVRRKPRKSILIESIIDSFIAKTKQGPDYVCIACHRLIYRQTVVLLSIEKYTNARPHDVLRDLYTSFDGNQWICTTCHAAPSRGNTPTQALANGLKLAVVPPELSGLNTLEIKFLSAFPS